MRVEQLLSMRLAGCQAEAGAAITLILARVDELNTRLSEGESRFKGLHVRLALDEALLNAIEHGCGGDAGRFIDLRVSLTHDFIEVTISDPGQGFFSPSVEASTPKDLSRLLNRGMQRGRGWGIPIIRAVAKAAVWGPRGNSLTLLFCR
jgi:anti-sigma regulatory factor (Ser/Thr protein kinase)